MFYIGASLQTPILILKITDISNKNNSKWECGQTITFITTLREISSKTNVILQEPLLAAKLTVIFGIYFSYYNAVVNDHITVVTNLLFH